MFSQIFCLLDSTRGQFLRKICKKITFPKAYFCLIQREFRSSKTKWRKGFHKSRAKRRRGFLHRSWARIKLCFWIILSVEFEQNMVEIKSVPLTGSGCTSFVILKIIFDVGKNNFAEIQNTCCYHFGNLSKFKKILNRKVYGNY